MVKQSRRQKLKEVITYFWGGVIFVLDLILARYFLLHGTGYLNFNIDFTKSLELGFLILKVISLVLILAFNFRVFKNISNEWAKARAKEKEIKEFAEEKIKRMNIFRKFWFFWKSSEAKSRLDKFNDVIKKLERQVGRIKGEETKTLKKLKKEMIKSILIWKEDFAITRLETKKIKKGKKVIEVEERTTIPVDIDFLEKLTLDELYEDYLLPCVESADKFINGVQETEVLERV